MVGRVLAPYAVRVVNQTLTALGLTKHADKTFIGSIRPNSAHGSQLLGPEKALETPIRVN
jgi:hypothetical protein